MLEGNAIDDIMAINRRDRHAVPLLRFALHRDLHLHVRMPI